MLRGNPCAQGLDLTGLSKTIEYDVGALGGNSLLLDGSAGWKSISKMTNYWASPDGGYWNAW